MAVFERDKDTGDWMPSPSARGPFAGLQGSAIAGLLTAEIESLADERRPASPVDVVGWFVRPTPGAAAGDSP